MHNSTDNREIKQYQPQFQHEGSLFWNQSWNLSKTIDIFWGEGLGVGSMIKETMQMCNKLLDNLFLKIFWRNWNKLCQSAFDFGLRHAYDTTEVVEKDKEIWFIDLKMRRECLHSILS